MAPPVRDDRPGQRRVLAGRRRRPPVAPPRRDGRRARDARRRRARHHRRLRGRSRRRGRQPPHQRLPHHPADPAPHRRLRLPQGAGHDGDGGRPRARPLGVRGAHPPRAGPVPQEPRLRPGGEDRRRVDAADRLRRADAEHDQPHRGGVRARLLHRAPRRRRARVPRPRRHVGDELGRHRLLGAGELDRAPGRVVAVHLPEPRARLHRARPRAHPRRHRRDQQSAPAHGEGREAAAGSPCCSAAGCSRDRGRAHDGARRGADDDGDRRPGRCSTCGSSSSSTGASAPSTASNLQIRTGEILGLAGESGCGKSTVANAILQILRPPARIVSGSVLFQGDDLVG